MEKIGGWREERLNMKRYGYSYFIRCFYFFHSNDQKNFLLSNVDIAETSGGLKVDEEARQRYIFRIHIYRYIFRKEKGRGVNMDPTNRGRYHTHLLSSSINYNREQIKSIGERLVWELFSWELEILSLSNPHPHPPLP